MSAKKVWWERLRSEANHIGGIRDIRAVLPPAENQLPGGIVTVGINKEQEVTAGLKELHRERLDAPFQVGMSGSTNAHLNEHIGQL
jgi:hypothetical protein